MNDIEVVYSDDRFKFVVLRMEMSWGMISVVHRNYDSKESCELYHDDKNILRDKGIYSCETNIAVHCIYIYILVSDNCATCVIDVWMLPEIVLAELQKN